MNHVPTHLPTAFKHLFVVLLGLMGLFAAFAPAPAAAETAQVSSVEQAAEEDPCAQPCPGEAPEEDGCVDECFACGCCATVASAMFPSYVAPSSTSCDPRGDLPGIEPAARVGVQHSVFKPPRLFSV